MTAVRARGVFDTLWDDHVVEHLTDGSDLLFIDLVIAGAITVPPVVREIGAPFDGGVFDPERIVAGAGGQARAVERGYVRPGMTVCCSDRQAHTLGALGCVAIGVGAIAESGAMLSGCVVMRKPPVVRVALQGVAPCDITARSLWNSTEAALGSSVRGAALEYAGKALGQLPMGARFALCESAVRAGARTAIVIPDALTATYLSLDALDTAHADDGAAYGSDLLLDAATLEPLPARAERPALAAPPKLPSDALDPGVAAGYLDFLATRIGAARAWERKRALDASWNGQCGQTTAKARMLCL